MLHPHRLCITDHIVRGLMNVYSGVNVSAGPSLASQSIAGAVADAETRFNTAVT